MDRSEINEVENLQLEHSDDIHAVIGQMALQLLKTGQPLQAQNMMARLQQQLEHAAECAHKQDYTMAMRAIADRAK